MEPILRILHERRAELLDRLSARIIETIPGYAELSPSALRSNLGQFLDEILGLADDAGGGAITEHLVALSRQRASQGFSASDYTRAVLLVLPVIREFVRTVGPPHDPSFARAFAELEAVLHRLGALAASFYVEASSRQLEAKNLELNRLNQQLQARERAANLETAQVSRALASANQFNQRVLESLTSGLMVVQAGTLEVTLYSNRMEQILGIPAEQVLGKHAREGLGPLWDAADRVLQTVHALGRMPLTKMLLPTRERPRTVLVRANRMYDPDGQPEGTVTLIDDVSERELLMDSFSRYISRDLLDRLLARAEPLRLEGERRVCTVLFADIRGFTTLAEDREPEEVHALLNAYFRVMIASIVEQGGFIDKFVGDKVMALFTEAANPDDAAAAALQAARNIHQRISKLSRERAARGELPVEVGIGINTGEVLLGNIGSEDRMEFTAIGDAVNVADRLQSLARGGEVLVGEESARRVGDRFALIDRGPQALKGRGNTVRAFQLQLVEPTGKSVGNS